MTLIALLAFSAGLKGHHLISQSLLGVEGFLLACGVLWAWWIRRDRWVLKAALTSGIKAAATFQSAAQLLGVEPSSSFPTMALWRAAQDDRCCLRPFTPDQLAKLKEQVAGVYEQMRDRVHRHHSGEAATTTASWLGAAVVLLCITYAIWQHSLFSEFLAIWLPSAVGAIHSTAFRRQLVRRIGVAQEFIAELVFVQKQLYSLVPDNELDADNSEAADTLTATLRVLCRAAGEHAQNELQFALGEVPQVPL